MFLDQELVDTALKCDWCISWAKKHYLVFEMAITSLESYLPFIVFLDLYLIRGIGYIEISETSNPTYLI